MSFASDSSNKVAIVLVNYNGRAYLDACIQSIMMQSYANYEIIMVDNQSVDGSAEMIEANYDCVHVIHANQNNGWAYGSNLGAEYALKNKADYILLLNTDTEIDKDMLTRLIMHADQETVTVPTMYAGTKYDRKRVWYAGGKIDYVRATVNQISCEESIKDCAEETIREVDFITGCCMLIHKDIWAKMNGFECGYFMYYEDVDYSIQMKLSGVKMIYVPSAVLYHKVGGSGGGEVSYLTEYYTVRNRLFLAERYNHLMQTTTMEVLRYILEERNYFQTYSYQPYVRFAMAGIKDFLKGHMSIEGNLFGNNFIIKSGFYDKEKNKTDVWYWGSKRESELEIKNPHDQRMVMSFISAIYLPAGEQRSVSVFVKGKIEYTLQLPEVFHYECIMQPQEIVNLCFVTDEPILIEGDWRGLTFQLANPEVTFRPV